jgi:hypothetical protein
MIALNCYLTCGYVSRTEHRFLLNFELASGTLWNALDANVRESGRNEFALYLESLAIAPLRRGLQSSLLTLGDAVA